MDLKIYAHSIQDGVSACTLNSTNLKPKCAYTCVSMPKGQYKCLCPDGMDDIGGNFNLTFLI